MFEKFMMAMILFFVAIQELRIGLCAERLKALSERLKVLESNS